MSQEEKKKLLWCIFGLFCTLIMFFPIYWMFVTSIKPMNEVYHSPPLLIPKNPTLAPYLRNFVKDTSIYSYFKNSTIISLGSMFFVLLLATPASYGLARLKIKGKAFIMLILLTVQMFPAIVLVTPLYISFSRLGLTNNYFGLILANTTISLPFVILVLRPYFLSLPKGLEDAAVIDGCNKWSVFWRIMLPLTKPGLVTVGAFSFLFAWGELLFAMTLTSKESMRPITAGIYRFIGQFQAEWNSLMAVAFLASLPIIIIFVLLQKHIVSGITAGAVKQ